MSAIKEKGLLPMSRQYVHLSVDTEMALQVGKRRDSEPAILKIDARKAFQNGIKFYIGNDKVWLCDFVPSQFILSNSLLRPDQEYAVEFNGKEGSSVIRFSKEKPRLAQNIEKMYVSGVFGGLPQFEENEDK